MWQYGCVDRQREGRGVNVDKSVFSRALRSRREGRGWTQEVMAKKLSISPRKYSRWEDGDDHLWLDVEELFRLGDIFDIEPTSLLGHTPFMREANKEKKIVRLYRRLMDDKVFYMFVYAAMAKSSDALSTLLDYWVIENDDHFRR